MEQELRNVLKSPGNEFCADCGARYPRFASISLAIFLCNRCYGIHRSVGAHITRTKTVGLDRWSVDEIQRMSSIGNVVAKAYWEQNVPTDYVRPTGDSQDFVVEKWIRDKYERKLFCPPDTEPPSIHPQTTRREIRNSITSIQASPQVKILPRGSLRCGPDCVGPTGTHESRRISNSNWAIRDELRRISNSNWATTDELGMQRNSSQVPVMQGGGGVAQISPSPGSSNPHPAAGLPEKTANGGVADDEFGDFVGNASMFHTAPDDDEFGDFVQA